MWQHHPSLSQLHQSITQLSALSLFPILPFSHHSKVHLHSPILSEVLEGVEIKVKKGNIMFFKYWLHPTHPTHLPKLPAFTYTFSAPGIHRTVAIFILCIVFSCLYSIAFFVYNKYLPFPSFFTSSYFIVYSALKSRFSVLKMLGEPVCKIPDYLCTIPYLWN